MHKNLRVLPLIPVIIFLLSVLFLFFSPLKIIPCETSETSPATSWTKSQCNGYYLTINEQSDKVNNSAFLINLVILLCGSFSVNGILFLIFLIISALSENRRSKLPYEPEAEREEETIEQPRENKRRFSLKELFRKKPAAEFEKDMMEVDKEEN